MAQNIQDPNTRAFPYWPPLGIQQPAFIPGQQLAGEVQDIRINRIPQDTDFNQSDVRRLPTPNAPANDVTGAGELLTHSAPMGRGSGIGLMDMLQMSIAQQGQQGTADKNGS